MNLMAIRDQTIDVAMETGSLLLKHYDQPHTETTKSTDIDIVTEVDQRAESLILEHLTSHYPDHHIVGEEGGGQGAPRDSAEYLWFIDPIDGTTNFANHIPHFCTSLAMTDQNQQPLVGIIYDPMRDELFAAARGQGATLNGSVIQVSRAASLIQSVLASGFAYDKQDTTDNNSDQWKAFMLRTRGVRRFGSAALDFCYVAAGRYDGYWERALNPWDALAGMLIVQEAGGIVTDYHNGDQPQRGDDGRFVASNGHIHQAMLDVLRESYADS